MNCLTDLCADSFFRKPLPAGLVGKHRSVVGSPLLYILHSYAGYFRVFYDIFVVRGWNIWKIPAAIFFKTDFEKKKGVSMTKKKKPQPGKVLRPSSLLVGGGGGGGD